MRPLQAYLLRNHQSGTTPTLTIRREAVLESAVEVLREEHFSMLIRVRFRDERGVDAGGVSR